jgi:DNA-binding transcriptional ArsR family regulator
MPMTNIAWDTGTAYDFFISLLVLHQAALFGLRPSWAAGVRQRISAPRREFLEQMYSFSGTGLEWVCSLPAPKDAADALRLAADLEPAARFEALTLPAEVPAGARAALHAIAARGAATAAERETLKANYIHRGQALRPAGLENLVSAWSAIEASGEGLLAALQEYHTVFFAEEETRLRPALEAGLANARGLADRTSVDALVESLSRGVRIADLGAVRTLTLAPSYWTSPLVFHIRPRAGQVLLVFGVRSTVQSVAPGAGTPDMLVMTLKSLADPTRLRILRFLSGEALAPAELARRLRLRPPTVTHHLHALRLAGLVQVTVNEKNEKRYAARLETLNELNTTLQEFLTKQDEHD